MTLMQKKFYIIVFLIVMSGVANAQSYYMQMIDTTTDMGRKLVGICQNFGPLRFTGYVQPQFQWAESKGAKTFEGIDFAPNSNNRFMMRENRLKAEYYYTNKANQLVSYMGFQLEATERGVSIRDMHLRLFENKWRLFSLSAGMYNRPFSYELNLSSADRESPDRARMSQTLMRTERDIGASITFEPRGYKTWFMNHIKADVGVFNGEGLTATTDFDSYKDIIGRVAIKPSRIEALHMEIAAGTSVLYGALGSQSPWIYNTTADVVHGYAIRGDSTPNHVNEARPRHYYGADVQIRFPSKKWATEIRGECIIGTQTAVATSSETPGTYPINATGIYQPLYTRPFNGAYFYFLQNIASSKHQLVVKYDWFDPNSRVAGMQVSSAAGFSAADVRFHTLGVGYVYYANPHVKYMVYYDIVKNESTNVAGYTGDLKDNILTCRIQYRF